MLNLTPRKQDDALGWALTAVGATVLLAYLPHVSWFTPGSAGRFRALFYALVIGATYVGIRLRLWPVAIGGVGLLWLTYTPNPGG
jgi:hypothetical protein